MYDITILGAGPAGSTFARLLKKGYKVLVLDRRDLNSVNIQGREKPCGGLLAPDAQKMLAILGLGLPKEILVGPQIFTVRTIDLKNKIEQYYQRDYINFNREKFDRWLVNLIPDNIETRFGISFKGFSIQGNIIKFEYLHNNKLESGETKYLVGADGAASCIRKILSPRYNPKKYVSIQEYFKCKETFPYFSAIFDPDTTDFYSWTIPKDDLLILGTAIPVNERPVLKFKILKEKLSGNGFELSAPVKKNGCLILRPVKSNQIYLGNDSVFLIGEAAGWISPSSAEGLSYAFISAINLAHACNENLDIFRTYSNLSKTLKRNIFIKNLKSPFMYNSFLRKLVMKSGLKAMKLYNGNQ